MEQMEESFYLEIHISAGDTSTIFELLPEFVEKMKLHRRANIPEGGHIIFEDSGGRYRARCDWSLKSEKLKPW